jgi:DNA-3-methyladenine glycosylase II
MSQTNLGEALSFQLFPLPPFRLDLTAWALRREPTNKLDSWDGAAYRRTIAFEGAIFGVSVRQNSNPDSPSLEVELTAGDDLPGLKRTAVEALGRLLGLRVDLTDFYRFAAAHNELASLVQRFRGVKPPRFLDLFETLANGIIFQKISLTAGTSILNRLVETYGPATRGAQSRAFPLPETIADLNPEDLRSLGLSRQKGKALIEIARGITGGLNLEQAEIMNDDEAIAFLQQLQGIGRWTSQYALLRGLGRLHIFPGDDVGARNKVKNWLGLEQVPDYEKMQDLNARWHPYGGMVYFHLLLNHIAEKGYLT